MSEARATGRRIVLIGADAEFGVSVARTLAQRGHAVMALTSGGRAVSALRQAGATARHGDATHEADIAHALRAWQADLAVNLAPQYPNSLLHDGHKWSGYHDILPANARATLRAIAAAGTPRLITTSYALLYGDALNADPQSPRVSPGKDPVFTAAIAAENMFLDDETTSQLVRFGYLYGPESRDLWQYRRSFEWRRPYFAGPSHKLTNWVHYADAAEALARLVEGAPRQRVYDVVDGSPVEFGQFMDTFALLLGFPLPRHIPLWGERIARLIITRQQMELLDLSTTVSAAALRDELGWAPQYPTYRLGLEQVAQTWRAEGRIKRAA